MYNPPFSAHLLSQQEEQARLQQQQHAQYQEQQALLYEHQQQQQQQMQQVQQQQQQQIPQLSSQPPQQQHTKPSSKTNAKMEERRKYKGQYEELQMQYDAIKAESEKMIRSIAKTKHAIKRLRLERTILIESLVDLDQGRSEDSEDSDDTQDEEDEASYPTELSEYKDRLFHSPDKKIPLRVSESPPAPATEPPPVKPATNSFLHFCSMVRQLFAVNQEDPNGPPLPNGTVQQLLRQAWSITDKAKYTAALKVDKERYQKELDAYYKRFPHERAIAEAKEESERLIRREKKKVKGDSSQGGRGQTQRDDGSSVQGDGVAGDDDDEIAFDDGPVAGESLRRASRGSDAFQGGQASSVVNENDEDINMDDDELSGPDDDVE